MIGVLFFATVIAICLWAHSFTLLWVMLGVAFFCLALFAICGGTKYD
jgi:hypothetical protein